MKKRKKHPSRLLRPLVVAIMIALAISTIAEDYDWDDVYRPQDRTAIVPVIAEGLMLGLDAKARGIGVTANGTEVDKWYWSAAYSNDYPLDFGSPGMMIIIR